MGWDGMLKIIRKGALQGKSYQKLSDQNLGDVVKNHRKLQM